MKKKLLSTLLALCMVLTLLPVTVQAATTSGTCGDNVTWAYSNGVLTIQGTGPMYDYVFNGRDVPWNHWIHEIQTINIGNGVTSIETAAFKGCSALTSVTIPNSVTIIRLEAFCNCRSLSNVVIPNGVTWIEQNVFWGCESLTSVTIPNSITFIGDSAFAGCSHLTSINVASGNSAYSSFEGVLFNANQTLIHTYPAGKDSLSYYIPDSVTTIGNSAFYRCSNLTSVTIPSSVTEIWFYAFLGCNSLTDVYYGGRESQWGRISIITSEGGNDPLLNSTIHYNSTGPNTTPTPGPSATFSDVPKGEWYAAAVDWAVEYAITNGTNDGSNGQPRTFSPSQTCTQAQILTFLYRAARGEGAVSADDMTKAVNWARDKGMINDTFDGSVPCTRSTAMRYIWQAFGSPSASSSTFIDVPVSADYATAVSWAVANGITNGTNDGTNGQPKTFGPNEVCTRGHIVTFLHRAHVPEARLQ